MLYMLLWEWRLLLPSRRSQSVVIFFPGDLQDEDAIMYSCIICSHGQVPIRRCKSISGLFLRRNPANLAFKVSTFKVLQPNPSTVTSSVFIIRPSHKLKEISMYGEYLDCDEYGNVRSCKICECLWCTDNPNGNAVQTLHLLIENYVRSMIFDNDWCLDFSGPLLPITLIGFSRGGLVLNQLLAELGVSPQSTLMMQSIERIHWLDCGNGNRELTFPVLSKTALDFLARYSYADISLIVGIVW